MAEIHSPEKRGSHASVLADARAERLDAVGSADITALFKEHGAILFRGFEVDVAAFTAFAGRFCSGSVFNESAGRLLIDRGRNIQSVNVGTAAFPLHAELAREPWRPDVCFFGCLNPPAEGGETTICDGIEVVRRMPEDVRAAFRDQRLVYMQPTSPEQCEYWFGTPVPTEAELANPPARCPFRFLRYQGRLLRTFSRPALQAPMFGNEPAFANFLLFARYAGANKAVPMFENWRLIPQPLVDKVHDICNEASVAVRWQAGDVIMIDNSRFMHGRNKILNIEERRIISYFGYLHFAEPSPEEPPKAPWREPGFAAPHN